VPVAGLLGVPSPQPRASAPPPRRPSRVETARIFPAPTWEA